MPAEILDPMLRRLSCEDLGGCRILHEQKLFEMEHAELEFTDSALREIARIAKIKDTGARGLRSVIEEVMFDLMFELPEQEPGQRFIVTPEIVRKEQALFVKDAAAA